MKKFARLTTNPLAQVRSRTAHPAVHPPKLGWPINGYLGKSREGYCGNSDVTVVLCPGVTECFPPQDVMGDDRPQLRAATACGHTLFYSLDSNEFVASHWTRNYTRV